MIFEKKKLFFMGIIN